LFLEDASFFPIGTAPFLSNSSTFPWCLVCSGCVFFFFSGIGFESLLSCPPSLPQFSFFLISVLPLVGFFFSFIENVIGSTEVSSFPFPRGLVPSFPPSYSVARVLVLARDLLGPEFQAVYWPRWNPFLSIFLFFFLSSFPLFSS